MIAITIPETSCFSHVESARLELHLLWAHDIDKGIAEAIEVARALGRGAVVAFTGNDGVKISVTERSNADTVFAEYVERHRRTTYSREQQEPQASS
jgi:hypothetical protein